MMRKLFLITALALCYVPIVHAETYKITSALDWEVLAKRADNGETFKGDVWNLQADISISVKAMPSFAGTIEGNGHTVTSDRPLVNVLEEGGSIRNLSKKGLAAYWGTYGCIVNEVAGTVVRCKNYSNFKIISYSDHIIAGGIAGKVLYNGAVIDCENHGNISGTTQDENLVYFPRLGGIAGWNLGTVMGCVNTGDVTATADATASCGGIVGHMESGSVSFCNNSGKVSSAITYEKLMSSMVHQRTGGIVGRTSNARIDACVNSGTVTNNMNYVGGITGECYMTDLTNCVNTATIFSTEKYFDSYAGGIAGNFEGKSGSQALLLNCSNTGNVTSNTSTNFRANAAGICAIAFYTDYGNCLNSGAISASGKNTYKDALCITGNGCRELNKPADVAEANQWSESYNADKSHHYLMPIAAGASALSYFNRFGVICNQGSATFYSASDKNMTVSIVPVEGGSARNVEIAALKDGVADNLCPDTEYFYTLSTGSNIVTRNRIKTRSLNLKLVQDVLRWNTLQAHAQFTAAGLEKPTLLYRLGDGETGVWTEHDPAEDGSFMTKDLKENHFYHLIAVLSWNGGTAESEPLRVTTPYISPDYVEVARGLDWLSYNCTNVDDLLAHDVSEYGIYAYNESSKGVRSNIEIYKGIMHPTLRINHKKLMSSDMPVHIEGYTVRDGETKYFPLDVVKLPLNEMENPDFVSPTAFRLRAGIFNGYPTDVAIYGSYQSTRLDVAHCAVNGNLCHFLCKHPGPAFYNVYIKYKGTTKCSKDVDLTSPNCEHVPPYLWGLKRGSGMNFTCGVACGEDGLEAWTYVIRARELGTAQWVEWPAKYKKPSWNFDYYEASGSINTADMNYNPAKTYEIQFCARRGNDYDVSETMLIGSIGNQYTDTTGIGSITTDPDEEDVFGSTPDTYCFYTLDGRCVLTLRHCVWSEVCHGLNIPRGIYIVVPSRHGPARKLVL